MGISCEILAQLGFQDSRPRNGVWCCSCVLWNWAGALILDATGRMYLVWREDSDYAECDRVKDIENDAESLVNYVENHRY